MSSLNSADHEKKQWSFEEAMEIFNTPFMELIYRAQTVHRTYFNPNHLQLSTLCSIKTGGCPEDCAYCPQSARYSTFVEKDDFMSLEDVIAAAKKAKEAGADRFCMGAALRQPRDEELKAVCKMISEVKGLGLETCATIGLLSKRQAVALKEAGLDFYNHNIDTSPEYYSQIITTRHFNDRLQTIENVRAAGIKVCCGGIIGMGETAEDRVKMLVVLANLTPQPESIPINKLVKVEGTPLGSYLHSEETDEDEIGFVKVIALARIMMPQSYVRLSAGRESTSESMQALCFLAGANSIFYGEKLLTTPNPSQHKDFKLLQKLGINSFTSRLDGIARTDHLT